MEEALARIEQRNRDDSAGTRVDSVRLVIADLSARYLVEAGNGRADSPDGVQSLDPTDTEDEPDSSSETAPEVSHDWATDIRAFPVMPLDRQLGCAIEIEAGVIAAGVLDGSIPRRIAASDQQLSQVVRRGEMALDEMLLGNVRLALYWALHYARGDSELAQDLFQDGWFGLHRAVEGWDALRGYRFSTYATWQIRQAIQRGMQQHPSQSPVHIPVHVIEEINASDDRESLSSNADIALQWMEQRVSWERLAEEVPEFRSRLQPEFEDSSLVQLVQEIGAQQVLSLLGERAAFILAVRNGIGGADPATLDAIGERLNITRERVRQLEARALNGLRLLAVAQSAHLQAHVARHLGSDPSEDAELAYCALMQGLFDDGREILPAGGHLSARWRP